MRLADGDIRTREILSWQGVHLLHAPGSSCSQKLRIFLNVKGIPWVSHVVDLKSSQNHSDWYLGINPLGLVPCLVHDGDVHIESNDILEYLEDVFPEPSLIWSDRRNEILEVLEFENQLHRDLRVLTFRYIIPTQPGRLKDPKAVAQLKNHTGTVQGQIHELKLRELEFWETANQRGISDQQVAESVARFKDAFEDLDKTCAGSEYLLGNELSVIDIAWYVYTNRLSTAGYPLAKRHPNLARWFQGLNARPEFSVEVVMPRPMEQAGDALRRRQREQGRSLEAVGGL